MKTLIQILWLALWLMSAAVLSFAGEVALTWDAPTTYVDGSPLEESLTYDFYEGGTLLASGLTTNVFTVTLPPPPTHKVSYSVVAVSADGWPSDHSLPCVIKKPSQPGKPHKE